MGPSAEQPTERRDWLAAAAVTVALLLLVAAIYGRAGHFEAQGDFDDNEYVYANENVLGGLTGSSVVWAMTAFHAANWHPLTWISHMLDIQLFGAAPGPHHLVNVALHAANAVLLFLVLRSATSAFWPSAVVAALFAVHPLNVETVAWVSQRKSLLSTLFLFLAVGAYVAWTRHRDARRFVLVVLLLALGLLAKPMLVSAPLLLIALDFWPLDRFRSPSDAGRLLLEKVPLFALVAVISIATILAQSAGGAVAPSATYPLGERIANALVSCVLYLRDVVWPAKLAAFYPHPASIGERTSLAGAAGAAVLLAGISALAWVTRRTRPWLIFGWCWFLASVAPVIGILQVGSQSRADRYTYVPMIGIFVAVVWEIAARVRESAGARRIAALAAATAVTALAVVAVRQVNTWRDGETLFTYTLSVTRRNWFAANNLGTFLMRKRDLAGALASFEQSARWKPDYEEAYYNQGFVLNELHRYPEAIAAFQTNLRLAPGNIDGWDNFGYALVALRRYPEALGAFETALSQKPDDAMALHGAAAMRASLGDRAAALQYLARLERVDRSRASQLRRDLGAAQ